MYKVFVKFSTRVGKVRGNRPFWYTIVYLSYQAGAGKSRRTPERENGKGPGKWETARVQKGQPQKGGGKDPGRRERRAERRQKGRRAQKGRDGEIPSRLFVLLLPCLPLDALTGDVEQEYAVLSRPASQPDSSPAGPWGSPPAPAKISIFAGPRIASPGPEMNPGPGKGLTGDPWTPSRAMWSRNMLSLSRPASQPDSSPAGPWESAPVSRKNFHFCGTPYCITGARNESGPRQGSHGGPLDALTGDVEQENAVS